MPERFTVSPLISRPLPAHVLFLYYTALWSFIPFLPSSSLPSHLPHSRHFAVLFREGTGGRKLGSSLGIASWRYDVMSSGGPEAAEGEGMLGAVTEPGTRLHSGSEL